MCEDFVVIFVIHPEYHPSLWFFKEAEFELREASKKSDEGFYLVRESMSIPGSYVLTWCQQNKFSHVQIVRETEGYRFNVRKGLSSCETLTKLIESDEVTWLFDPRHVRVVSPECSPEPILDSHPS